MDGTELPFDRDQVAGFLDRVVDLGPGRGSSSFADVSAGIARLDLPAGTPVIIALPNGRPFLEHWFAVLLAGAVPMALSPATASARIVDLAARVGAGAVIAARVDPSRYGVADARPVGDQWAVRLPTAVVARPAGTVLMLTSGTSGLFSVCLHRAGSLVRNAARHAQAVGLRADDTVLVNLPLFYSYAIVAQALAALVTGARLVISGPPFSPPAYPALLVRHDITSSSITPTIARLLLHRGEKLPRALRMLTIGGDDLAARHVARLRSALPETELYVTYGLTEAGPRVSTFAAHAEPEHRFGSVGRPLPGVSTSLRDLSGGVGELLVHTDTALLSKSGAAGSDRALVSPGVVATGDRFRIDDDGYHHFAGRVSDFVVIRGEKVSLAGVRAYVQSLTAVTHCRTQVFTDQDGYVQYEMEVGVADAVEPQVRRQILSFLLPAERPRALTIAAGEPAGFQK